jgi:hypothetical protein
MSDMEKKTYRLTFRVTEKEGEFLRQIAGAEGRPVGNLIRKWLMLHYMEKLALTPEEISEMKEKIESDTLAEISKKKKKRGHAKKAA